MTDRLAGRRRAAHRILAIVGLAALLSALAPVAPVAAATDRLPDLRAANITDFRIATSGGRRLLRFTGTMWNKGDGPFETRSNRSNSTTSVWDVDQLIYRSDGTTRRIETAAGMQYAGDGHDHWHVRSMLTYHLWGAKGTLRSSKIGFCFFDTNRIDGSLPRSPTGRVYLESSCGKKASLSTRNGISVGWGDKYPWNFAYQWIDITGMPAGTYTVRAAVDLYGNFTEKSETNNCAWARIKFNASGTAVSVLSRGQGCINDHSTSPYAEDIAWAREAGIAGACDVDIFCTNNVVNRGQAATFVRRALELPEATKDWFTDDESDGNEANINRLAEAGAAPRCAVGKYCPTRPLLKEQLSYMMTKALALPPATDDYFDDDDGMYYEQFNNAVAEAGIVTGCAVRRYCPTEPLTRGHLMAVLHRAVVPPTP